MALVPLLETYYAFMGSRGPSEAELMCELVSKPDFNLRSDTKQATVRITDFFVLNKLGEYASLDNVTSEKLFLHGHLVSEGGGGHRRYLVGNIPVRFWYVKFSDITFDC